MEIQQQPAAPNLYAALRVRYRMGVMKVLGLFRSRKQLPVNTLSDSGVAALMRYMYCRTKMLATTIVRSGSDRGGRHAFVSNFKGVGGKEKDIATGEEYTKPSAAAQVGVPCGNNAKSLAHLGNLMTVQPVWSHSFWAAHRGNMPNLDYAKWLFDTSPALTDFGIQNPSTKGLDGKLNVAHVVARWTSRANYWDATAQMSRPRDAARIHQENIDVDVFLSDLWVTDPRFNPGCSRLPTGAEVSHCAESYHNSGDWRTLEIRLCPFIRLMARGFSADAAHLAGFSTFEPGNKVELVVFEDSQTNILRQSCSRFSLHWLEIDSSTVEPQGINRRLRIVRPTLTRLPNDPAQQVLVDMDPLPERFPTCCPHSTASPAANIEPVPCYGPRPGPADLVTPTGLSPFRSRVQHERVSPNVGAPHGLPTYQIAR